MKIEIKCRFSGAVLFAHEEAENTMKLTVMASVKARANLAGANLDGAYLARAYLAGAYLAGANLAGANLAGAYLAGANLAGANLAGANLARANLDGEVLTKSPISLLNLKWSVLITSKFMRIGCKRHSHDDWEAFTDDAISNMADGALDFWKEWKVPLMAICETHGK